MLILVKQKGARYCFWFLILCVIGNYIRNLRIYQHIDRADMPSYLEISVCAVGNKFGWFLLTFITFLLVLPGGLSLAKEKRTKVDIHLINRCGGKVNYYISKIIAVMMVTFLCFAIPFILELFLNLCAFPIETSGKWLSVDIAYRQTEGMKKSFFLYSIYQLHPAIYALIRIGITSGCMALLSVIPLAVSCIYSKYYAYLLVPVYFLEALFGRTTFSIFGHKINHEFISYLWWGDAGIDGKQMGILVGILFVLAFVSTIFTMIIGIKGDVDR